VRFTFDSRSVSVKERRGGYIYVFQSGPVIKIGFTCDVEKRLTSHRQQFKDIELLRVIKAERYYDLEQAIHKSLRRYRIYNAWLGKECYLSSKLSKINKCIDEIIRDEKYGVFPDD
jgi:hypothetical protein